MVQRRKITVPGLALAALLGLGSAPQPALAASGPLDEAKLAGRDAASFPPADEDYFKGMDNGVALTPDEVKGRNMWLVWTGGDDRFWDHLTSAPSARSTCSRPSRRTRRSRTTAPIAGPISG